MKNVITCILVVAAAFSVIGCGGDDATKLAVALDGSAMTATPGETVVVVLKIENAVNFRAASFFVDFNTDLVTLVDASGDEAFLGSGGIAVHEPTDTGASIGVGRIGGSGGGAPESGVLARLTFFCSGEGTAEIVCGGFRIVDDGGRTCDGSDELGTVRAEILIGPVVD